MTVFPSPDFAIKARSLRKAFGPVVAVKNIDLSVVRGSITALLGGNGAGKSTTMAMLLGLLEPTSGSIEILGLDERLHRAVIAERINFSSPYVDLPNRLSIRQNLTVYGHLYGVPHLKQRISELGGTVTNQQIA